MQIDSTIIHIVVLQLHWPWDQHIVQNSIPDRQMHSSSDTLHTVSIQVCIINIIHINNIDWLTILITKPPIDHISNYPDIPIIWLF